MELANKEDLKLLVERLANYAERDHYYCDDDNWYSCPKSINGCADDRQDPEVCTCDADRINAIVDKTYKQIMEILK